MIIKEVTEECASMCHQKGVNCSLIVFTHAAAKPGFDEKQAMKISAPFGGGTWGSHDDLVYYCQYFCGETYFQNDIPY